MWGLIIFGIAVLALISFCVHQMFRQHKEDAQRRKRGM